MNVSTRHAKKISIYVGAPILFLVVLNATNAPRTGNNFILERNTSSFVAVGDEVRIALKLETLAPTNAIGGKVIFTPNTMEIASISRVDTIVDLWSEEPSYTNSEGVVQFSGGMIGDKTEAGIRGEVFTMYMHMKKEGRASISINDAEILANNGVGTNIASAQNIIEFYVREKGTPSPDVSGDGILSIADVHLLYVKTFRAYDARYDLNGDGKLSWADVRALLTQLSMVR